MKKAIVLLSGGLDSTTVLALASQNFSVIALSFRYQQRHQIELSFAAHNAQKYAKDHIWIDIDARAFQHSALTDNIAVPKQRDLEDNSIPVTYVPARNTLFLSYALAFAESIKAYDIFIGVNALDYSGYPDCRPEYIKAFNQMANLATKAGVEGQLITIHTPLIYMKKYEIIQKGLELGVDYSKTLSCYDPNAQGQACGHCDACRLRLLGFQQLSLKDPAIYQ